MHWLEERHIIIANDCGLGEIKGRESGRLRGVVVVQAKRERVSCERKRGTEREERKELAVRPPARRLSVRRRCAVCVLSSA